MRANADNGALDRQRGSIGAHAAAGSYSKRKHSKHRSRPDQETHPQSHAFSLAPLLVSSTSKPRRSTNG